MMAADRGGSTGLRGVQQRDAGRRGRAVCNIFRLQHAPGRTSQPEAVTAMWHVAEQGQEKVDLVTYTGVLPIDGVEPTVDYRHRFRIGDAKLTTSMAHRRARPPSSANRTSWSPRAGPRTTAAMWRSRKGPCGRPSNAPRTARRPAGCSNAA